MRESRERRRWRGAIAIAAVVVVAVIVGACSNPTNPETFTVAYEANGADSGTAPEDQTKTAGVELTVADNSGNLAHAVYTFAGWNTADDGSGGEYTEGATYTTDAELILYASWETYAIGDSRPAGGIVFYDKGEYTDGWRYLEAAPASTEWTSKPWGGYGTAVGTAAQGTAIGTGEANTQEIVAAYGDTEPDLDRADYAAKLAADLDHGGYDDWFLPSKDELNEMYVILYEEGSGGFASAYYWSSSEFNASNAWAQDFASGNQYLHSDDSAYSVRAVRAF